jgi:hypothetical protein
MTDESKIWNQYREVAKGIDTVLESYFDKGYGVMSLFLATYSWSKGLREYMRSEANDKTQFDLLMNRIEKMRMHDAASELRPRMEEIEDNRINPEKFLDALKKGSVNVQVVRQFGGKAFPAGGTGTNDPIESINWAIQFLKNDKIIAQDLRLSAQAYDLLALRLKNEAFGKAKSFESRDPMKVMSSFIIGYASGVGKCLKNVGDEY